MDVEDQDVCGGGLGAEEALVVSREGQAVRKLQALGDDLAAPVRPQDKDEAVGAAVEGLRPGLGMGRVGAPDVPVTVHDGVVGAGQPAAPDFGHKGLVDAGGGIEALEGPLFPVVDPEVGDQDPPLAVHVDPVRGAAPRAHPDKAPVGENLGHRTLVVGGEDPARGADDHILRPVNADGDLLEGRGFNRLERHGDLRGCGLNTAPVEAASTSPACAAKAGPAARRAP